MCSESFSDMFSELNFWERRYKGKPELFDWYVQLPVFIGLMRSHFQPDYRFLVLGAGTSRLPYQLYDMGFHNITCIDFSPHARDSMASEVKSRTGLEYLVQDVLELRLPDLFDVVIEKSLFDCLLTTPHEPLMVLRSTIKQVRNVVKPEGLLFSLSFDSMERPEILEYASHGLFSVTEPLTVKPIVLEATTARIPNFYLYTMKALEPSEGSLSADEGSYKDDNAGVTD